ncbi:MAG: hypothetical protein D6689_11270 [Deltaproteobacteria bacterium]|nr:MAG: hypothetical protein D6689_11270 [Deltaproteobacteria bacterium]
MKDDKILKNDPLRETDEILREEYYGRAETAAEPRRPRRARRAKKPKPTHYKVVCISLYTKDIEELERKVAELKRRGHTKANKSQLIRFALSQVDIDKLPPPV